MRDQQQSRTVGNAQLRADPGSIEAGVPPFLLAVPTDATGALDAAELVRRISVLDGLGVTPAPVDLAQALLRVTPTTDGTVLGAAERLASDAGRRLAWWLRAGGLPHWEPGPSDWTQRHVRPEPAAGPPLLPAAASLIGPYRGDGPLCEPMVPFWLAQLPHHREVVLARDYFRDRADGRPDRGWAHALPYAAESGGPAGYDGSAVLRPSVRLVPDPADLRQVSVELPFPCVWVAPWQPENGVEPLRDSLDLVLMGAGSALVEETLEDPSIRNVYAGEVPSHFSRAGMPHDDYLAGFLMRAKGHLSRG